MGESWGSGWGQQGKNYEENKKKKKLPKVPHTRIDVTFFYIYIFLLHQQSPCHAMYKFARGQDLLTKPPSPPILGSNDKHYARPPVNEQKTTEPFKSFLPSFGFGYSWVGPSKNGRETANQGGEDKKKANGTHQDCFSDWVF